MVSQTITPQILDKSLTSGFEKLVTYSKNLLSDTEQNASSMDDNTGYRNNLPDGDAERHPKQLEFIHNTAHHSAIVGGIGSGKSQGGAVRAVRAAYGVIGSTNVPMPNIGMVTAPTWDMLRDASIRTFVDVAGDLLEDFKKADRIAIMKNGSEVIFRTADNPDHLRGPNLTWWWGDESAYYHADVRHVMVGRLRQHGHGYDWNTTTPKGRNHIYKVFVADHADDPDYYIIRVRTRDNGFLDEEYIKSLESEYDGDYAKQELEGEFVSFEGLIYPEFSREKHIAQPDDIPVAFHRVVAGVDWGYVHPGVINVYGVTSDNRVYQIHEEYATKRGIDEWADIALQLRDIYHIDRFVCDPSEPDYIKRFEAKGCKAYAANNTVSTGIQAVKRRLAQRADGKPGLLYYTGAVHNFAEKEQYQWARNRELTLDQPLKTNDHTQDAERYAIMDIDYVAVRKIEVTMRNYA